MSVEREMQTRGRKEVNMAGPNVYSVLVTGSNRGIGLELVKHFVRKPNPPDVIFATCRDPAGAQAEVRIHSSFLLKFTGGNRHCPTPHHL